MIKIDKAIIFARIPSFSLSIVRELYALGSNTELEAYARKLLTDERFRAALKSLNADFLSLLEEKEIWSRKELQTISFYILRMSYRPTPRGSVVGLARLRVGRQNSFLKNETMKLEHYPGTPTPKLEESLRRLKLDPKEFTFLTNPSLIRKGNTFWFIDRNGPQEKPEYFRGKVLLEAEGRKLLEFCRSSRTFGELLTAFHVDVLDEKEFLEFLYEFIGANLLEFDYLPSPIWNRQTRGDIAPSEHLKITLPENEISVGQLHGLDKVITGLYRISRVWDDSFSPWFTALKTEFRQNYSSQWIPLLDFILFHLPESEEQLTKEILEDPKSKEWNRLLSEAAYLGKEEISITEEMLNSFDIPNPDQPPGHPEPAYSVIFSLGKMNGKYRGKYVFGIEGWEGVRGYSRFTGHHEDVNYPDPQDMDKDTLFVDLDFLPDGIAAGVSLREETVSTFVRLSHLKSDPQRSFIDPSQIEVTLQAERFILRCRTTKKKIIPILTTPHIVQTHRHPLFRFFGFLAVQGKKTFLNVPFPPETMSYVPAISYRGYLLSPRRWMLRAEVLQGIACDGELRRKLGIPRWIVISEMDNILPVDLDSPISETIVGKFRRDLILTVEEDWHLTNSSPVEVGGKNHSHEVLFQWKPAVQNALESNPVILPSVKLATREEKIFAFHFHLPKELLDSFLLDVLLPLAKLLHQNKKMNGFYFVKFSQPSPHIRFRLFANSLSTLWEDFFLKALVKRETYLIKEASQFPFELELQTYGGKEGLAHYHEISKVFSESFSSYAQLRQGLSRVGRRAYGNPVDLSYLVLLCRNLSQHAVFIGHVESDFGMPGNEVKKSMAHFRKNHSDLLTNEALEREISLLMKDLDSVLKKLGKSFAKKKIKVSRQHFFRRLIHMQVFRLSDGSSPFLESTAITISEDSRS